MQASAKSNQLCFMYEVLNNLFSFHEFSGTMTECPQTPDIRSISQITSARNHGWNLGCKNFRLFFLPNEMALWKCCRFGYSIKLQPAKFMSYLEAINFQFNLISDLSSNMITLPLWCSAYAAVVCLLELPTTWQEHGKHSSSLQNPHRKQGQTDSK